MYTIYEYESCLSEMVDMLLFFIPSSLVQSDTKDCALLTKGKGPHLGIPPDFMLLPPPGHQNSPCYLRVFYLEGRPLSFLSTCHKFDMNNISVLMEIAFFSECLLQPAFGFHSPWHFRGACNPCSVHSSRSSSLCVYLRHEFGWFFFFKSSQSLSSMIINMEMILRW